MTIIPFDTVAYSKKLQEAGMPSEQADALTDAQREYIEKLLSSSELATKNDLHTEGATIRSELKVEIQGVRTELLERIRVVRDELREEIQAVRSELKEEIQAVGAELKYDIQTLRNELKEEIQSVRNDLADTKHEILKWMVTAMLAQTALLVGIAAFIK